MGSAIHGWDQEMAEPLELELENGVSENGTERQQYSYCYWNMRCYYINIIASSTKIQQANQCHGSRVTCRALTQISTTALLSQWNNIFCLAHCWPHVLTNSSFHKIDWTAWAGDQRI